MTPEQKESYEATAEGCSVEAALLKKSPVITPKPIIPSLVRMAEIRNERGCGVLEARKIASKEALIERIENARTIDDLRPVLAKIVEML